MLVSLTAKGQWYWVNPYPTGNTIYCTKFVDAATGYSACASGTILKTTNGGVNWSVTMLNNSANLKSLHFTDANTGIVVGEYGAVYRTTNAGNNWDKIFVNDSMDFRDIKFYDANTGILVTGYNTGGITYNPRIYKTTNGGLNWIVKHYNNYNFFSVSFANNNKVFVAGEHCLYKSTDAGETWDSLSGYWFQRYSNRSIMFLDSLTGFVLSSYYGIIDNFYVSKTTDGGFSWNQYYLDSNTSSYRELKSVSFINANTGIIVGWYQAVYRTVNGGVNWYKLPVATDSTPHFMNVTAFGSNSFLYSGEYGNIFRSINYGLNFTKITSSFTDETLNYVSFINNQTGIVCGNNGAIFKTVNGGLNWTQQYCPNSATLVKAKLFDADTGIAVSNNGRVYKTVNGGDNWILIFYDTTGSWGITDFKDSKFIRMTGGRCQHAGANTTNGGLTWTSEYISCCPTPIPSGCVWHNTLDVADWKHQIISGGQNYSHTPGPSFITVTYNGLGWNTLFSSDNTYFGVQVSYADTNNALLSFWQLGTGSLYRTNNGFRTIVNISIPNMSISDIALADSMNGIGFVSQRHGNTFYYKNSGIFKTTNGGQNWYLSGAISNDVEYLDYNKFNYAVAWGKGGTLVANQNPGFIIGINSVSSSIPYRYELFQNYPNPFNPTTQIKFELPNAGEVKLTVYDIMGREVETIVNERLAAGIYEVMFDGSGFASGVYFYRLTAEGYSETKKMVLVR